MRGHPGGWTCVRGRRAPAPPAPQARPSCLRKRLMRHAFRLPRACAAGTRDAASSAAILASKASSETSAAGASERAAGAACFPSNPRASRTDLAALARAAPGTREERITDRSVDKARASSALPTPLAPAPLRAPVAPVSGEGVDAAGAAPLPLARPWRVTAAASTSQQERKHASAARLALRRGADRKSSHAWQHIRRERHRAFALRNGRACPMGRRLRAA